MQTARRRDAGADVGHAGELEQALDGAVLAERAVQDRKDDVDVSQGGRNGAGGHGQCLGCAARGQLALLLAVPSRQRPSPVDLDGDRLVALGVERFQHRPRGREGDVVLARASAHQDGDATRPLLALMASPSSSCRWSSSLASSPSSSA